MLIEKLNKMTAEDIENILNKEYEYYGADELQELRDQLNYLKGYGEPIPKFIKCPMCDAVTEIENASCKYCGHKLCGEEYIEYSPEVEEREKDISNTEFTFQMYKDIHTIKNILSFFFALSILNIALLLLAFLSRFF